MNEKECYKTVASYTAMFASSLKKKRVQGCEAIAKRYTAKLTELYGSALFVQHDRYPTIDMKKVYAVIAMCLILKEDGWDKDQTIDCINFVFRKPKAAFYALEKMIDILPCAYTIAEKWNRNDHEKRVQDGSVIYEYFRLEDGRIEYHIPKCMYVEAFAAHGIREYCKIFCMTDTMAYANLTKHVNFYRYSDLSDGPCCHDVITRK